VAFSDVKFINCSTNHSYQINILLFFFSSWSFSFFFVILNALPLATLHSPFFKVTYTLLQEMPVASAAYFVLDLGDEVSVVPHIS
jgi:hypothetical protein